MGTLFTPGRQKEIQIDLGTGENSTVPIFHSRKRFYRGKQFHNRISANQVTK
uniref:Uncharacterized protein n=1 Tax=Klebsiella pneumoniae TaxID=573 RepID=A0A8B0SRT1_KLEPN|nr:hypothetical protein [Klebsiella pneumoniae]